MLRDVFFSQSLLTLNLIERYLEKFGAVCTPNAKITWKKNQTYLRMLFFKRFL